MDRNQRTSRCPPEEQGPYNTWLSSLNEVIKMLKDKDWYLTTSWASLAKRKIVASKSEKLTALIQTSFSRFKSWKDFKAVIHLEISPESETASQHFAEFLSKLKEPHNAHTEMTVLQSYMARIFDLSIKLLCSNLSKKKTES